MWKFLLVFIIIGLLYTVFIKYWYFSLPIIIGIIFLIRSYFKKKDEITKQEFAAAEEQRLAFQKQEEERKEQQKRLMMSYDFDAMDGHTFEYYCAELLKNNGYSDVIVTKGSGDYGADIIATNNQSGLKYAIQCKCYSSNVGNGAVQEVFAGKQMYGCDMAAVLTNQYFTKAAIETANATGVRLWDRKILIELAKRYKAKTNIGSCIDSNN